MNHASETVFQLSAAERQHLAWVQLLKFGIVGASGYLVNLAIFVLLADSLGIPHLAAAVVAFAFAFSSNYLWNRFWTFGSGDRAFTFQAARYIVVSISALLINLTVLEALVQGGMGNVLAQAISVAVSMPFNFLGNKLWTLS